MTPTNKIRDEITSQYTIDDHGLIRDLGKFQMEMLYVPFYWDAGMNGCASEDTGRVWFFEICTDERAAFPELGSAFGVSIFQDDNGFIYGTIHETQKAYERMIDKVNESQDGAQ